MSTSTERLNQLLEPLRRYLPKGSITSEEDVRIIEEYTKAILAGLVLPLRIGFPFTEVHRITINKKIPDNNNSRITLIEHLLNPPVTAVNKFGRANIKQQSVLYTTCNVLTALSEMRPAIGDLITVSTWALDDSKNFLFLPVFFLTSGNNGASHNALSFQYLADYNRMMQHETEEAQNFFETLQTFISEAYAKDVDSDNHFDYALSAFISNMIYKLGNTERHIEAIVYPSVRQSLGFSNAVFKPESFKEKFELNGVKEGRITIIPTNFHRGYFYDVTAETSNFNDTDILW